MYLEGQYRVKDAKRLVQRMRYVGVVVETKDTGPGD